MGQPYCTQQICLLRQVCPQRGVHLIQGAARGDEEDESARADLFQGSREEVIVDNETPGLEPPSLSPFVHSALPGTTAVEPREQPEIGLGIGLQEFGGIPREDAVQIKSAEYWLKLGEADEALRELEKLPARSWNRAGALKTPIAAVRAMGVLRARAEAVIRIMVASIRTELDSAPHLM